MPRRQRIAYENAHYHIFNRAASRKTACFTADHYAYFLKLLGELTVKYSVKIYAYCMMSNHYHIYLSTPEGNISKAMWYFGRQFSLYINQSINADGPLFRGRFRDVLVDSDAYALQLTRYIHLNPVTAGLVKTPESYAWSSYLHYIHASDRPRFLDTTFIKNHFLNPAEFYEFTTLGVDKETVSFYTNKWIGRILGGSDFRKKFQ